MQQATSKRYFFWFGLIMLSVGLGVLAIPALFKPVPTVVLPGDIHNLDPEVASLIESQIKSVEAHPKDPNVHGTLGLIYEANTLWEEARQCFLIASSLGSQKEWRYHLAIATRQSGSFAEALDMMKNLAQEFPSFVPLQQRLGESLLEIGELEGAEGVFRNLIELSPQLPDGYTGLSAVSLARGDYARAAELLEHSVGLEGRYPLTRYRLGLAYRGLGRKADALREMSLGVDASPRTLPDSFAEKINEYAVNLTAQQNKAARLLQMGRTKEAVSLLEPLHANHPSNVTVMNNLAIGYMRQGEFDRSKKILMQALAVNDKKFSTYLNLSSLALRKNQFDMALEYADAAVKRAPDISRTHFTRAQVLANLNRHQDALLSLDSARQLNRTDHQTHTFIADLSLHLNRLEQAEVSYKEAIGLRPSFLPAQLGLTKVYLQQQRVAEAKSQLAAMRRIAPNHPQVLALEEQVETADK